MNYAELLIQNRTTEEKTEDINQCGFRKSEIDQIGDFDFKTHHKKKSFLKRKFFKKRIKD